MRASRSSADQLAHAPPSSVSGPQSLHARGGLSGEVRRDSLSLSSAHSVHLRVAWNWTDPRAPIDNWPGVTNGCASSPAVRRANLRQLPDLRDKAGSPSVLAPITGDYWASRTNMIPQTSFEGIPISRPGSPLGRRDAAPMSSRQPIARHHGHLTRTNPVNNRGHAPHRIDLETNIPAVSTERDP